jgi:hypothetical protein
MTTMKLQDLQYAPLALLPIEQTIYRIQSRQSRRGSVKVGPLKLAPAADMTGRFALASHPTGYFAESPETAIYESLVRREAVSLSLSIAQARSLLCLRTTSPIQLLDLRPHTPSWPVLQSLRFTSTQAIAADALAAGFAGIVYRSAQQYGQDCYVVFGDSLKLFKLVWQKPLVKADGSAHQALFACLRGGQIMVVP